MLDAFRRKGFVYALRMLGNADDAADAVQEGLSALWVRRRQFNAGRDPAAWFYRVLRNHCIDQIRRRRVRRHTPIDAAEPVAVTALAPDAAAEQDEFHARLAIELQNLDASHREILELRDTHGLSYAAIAEVLSVAPGTVMSRLHRARMQLRERLKDLI